MYLRKMPLAERLALCKELDNNGKWKDLARASYAVEEITIQTLEKEKSPTEELLSIWDIAGHTVLEVFLILNEIQQFRAMWILKDLVDTEHHKLIKNDAVVGIQRKMSHIKLNNNEICEKDLKLHQNNVDCVTDNIKRKLHEKSKLRVDTAAKVISDENNENYRTNKVNPKSPLEHASGARLLTGSDISYVTESAGAIPQIPYEDLKKATNSWDTSYVLGKGGFGTVFRGSWKFTQVAIKRLEQKTASPADQSEQIRQSITELHCLNAYRHDNILHVYGYSIDGPQPCLVYQFMPGDCLERRLRIRDQTKVLKWPTRMNIALGTARGLQFLHTIRDKPLVHGDIKSANILLDSVDTPRIGDFGLAREGPSLDQYVRVSRLHGTPPYLPYEFLRGGAFSNKIDIYSFGIVLFEVATALSAFSDRREYKLLKDHVLKHNGDVVELKDPRAEGGEQCFHELVRIGKLCVKRSAKERPEMVEVYKMLEVACRTCLS